MKGKFGAVMLVLVFLALVANLVFVAARGESPVGVNAVYVIVFAGLVLANLTLAGAGVYFVVRAHQKREKGSLGWARRAFVGCGVGTVLLALAPWFFYPDVKDTEGTRKAMFDVGVFLFALGLSTAFFTYAAYRDYLRVASSRGSGTRRRTPTLEQKG